MQFILLLTKYGMTFFTKYVNNEGLVNYKGIINDKKYFEQYLAMLSNNTPGDKWSKKEKEAYG